MAMMIRIGLSEGSLLLLLFVGWPIVMDTNGGNVEPRKEIYFPDYSIYHNLTRIQEHLQELADKYPSFIRLDWVPRSRQGRPQLLLRLTNFSDSTYSSVVHNMPAQKAKVLLSFGEHAREFLPIETLLYMLTNLTQGTEAAPGTHAYTFSKQVLSGVDLFVVAMVNPDGRMYVEKTGNYCWRGTSTGVDLNRNFDWHFGKSGSSANRLDEEYRGSKPFSEPEGHVLVDLTDKFKFDAFISLHSGIKHIYVPFADSESKRKCSKPDNLRSMLELAEQMSRSVSSTFAFGMAYQLNDYTADGTIFDYMSGVRKIPFSLAIELWGEGDRHGAKCFDLFNPTSSNLNKVLDEIYPIYKTLFIYMIDWKQAQYNRLGDPLEEAPSLTFGFILLGAVIVLTLLVALHSRLPMCLRFYPRRRVVSLRSLSSTFTIMGMLKV